VPFEETHLPFRAVTDGLPHFCGYYDGCPWSDDGSRLLVARAPFKDIPASPADPLALGFVDVVTGRFHLFDETTAWSWQQGARMQWAGGRSVLFNVRKADGTVVGRLHDLDHDVRRDLDYPVYCIRPGGGTALGLDPHRLQVTHLGYGYPPAAHLTPDRFATDADGLWSIDLETGRAALLLSFGRAARHGVRVMRHDAWHWFDHPVWSPAGQRIALLHRWRRAGTPWRTRLLTLRPDGSDLQLLDDRPVSHTCWIDETHLSVSARSPHSGDPTAATHWLLNADTGASFQFGEGILERDGHLSASPSHDWWLLDSYPSPIDGRQALLLYSRGRDLLIEIGRFWSPPRPSRELRCDLHPRFSHDGALICFDSAHGGTRQVYVMDIRSVVHS
jgi:hypothetical protein